MRSIRCRCFSQVLPTYLPFCARVQLQINSLDGGDQKRVTYELRMLPTSLSFMTLQIDQAKGCGDVG